MDEPIDQARRDGLVLPTRAQEAFRELVGSATEGLLTLSAGVGLGGLLLALYLSSPQTVCRLAEALALSQPSVSHSLRRLAARSLVRAGVDASDTRRRPQAITRGGERLAARFLRLRRSAG